MTTHSLSFDSSTPHDAAYERLFSSFTVSNLSKDFFSTFYTASPKLIQFDVDSTLITQEVIELLSADTGKLKEIEKITSEAMHGRMDFDESLTARVQILQGAPESVIDAVSAQLILSPGVRHVISRYKKAGHIVGLASGGFSQVIENLAADLNVDYYAANTLEIQNRVLTGKISGNIVNGEYKKHLLIEQAALYNVDLASTIAVGDGANDIPVIEQAGIGVAYCAKPVLDKVANLLLTTTDMTSLTLLDKKTSTAQPH